MKRGIHLRDIIHNVALSDEQVLPSVVVEILQTQTPPGTPPRDQPQPTLQTAVGENSVAIIVVERIGLLRQITYDNVRASIIIVVLKSNAHAGIGVAIGG